MNNICLDCQYFCLDQLKGETFCRVKKELRTERESACLHFKKNYE